MNKNAYFSINANIGCNYSFLAFTNLLGEKWDLF